MKEPKRKHVVEPTLKEDFAEIKSELKAIPGRIFRGFFSMIYAIMMSPPLIAEAFKESYECLPTKQDFLELKNVSFNDFCDACDESGFTDGVKDLLMSPITAPVNFFIDLGDSLKYHKEQYNKDKK